MESIEQAELIFVYNANATVFAVTIDFFHKLLSPDTYQCNLCRVTYGPVTMKNEWKTYLASLPFRISFFHKDEFMRLYPDYLGSAFPAVFIRESGKLMSLMTADEINRISTVEELKAVLSSYLTAYTKPVAH